MHPYSPICFNLLSLSADNQPDIIQAFNGISRYIADILNVKKKFHQHIIIIIIILCSFFDSYFIRRLHIVTCWSSGSAFDCRSRGPLFESYTGLTWFSLGTRIESPRRPAKVWIGTLRGWCLCIEVWYSWEPYVGCTQNRGWKSSKGDPNASFPNVA